MSTENRERMLKVKSKKKQITYKGKHIKITACLSTTPKKQGVNKVWNYRH
jgi:hypothetical protein